MNISQFADGLGTEEVIIARLVEQRLLMPVGADGFKAEMLLQCRQSNAVPSAITRIQKEQAQSEKEKAEARRVKADRAEREAEIEAEVRRRVSKRPRCL